MLLDACLLRNFFPLQGSVHLKGLSKISGLLALVVKAAIQFVILVWFLCVKIPRPDAFIVQVHHHFKNFLFLYDCWII